MTQASDECDKYLILTSQMKDQIMDILIAFAFRAVCNESGRLAERTAMLRMHELLYPGESLAPTITGESRKCT